MTVLVYWNALQAGSDSRYSVFGFLSCHMNLTLLSLYAMTMSQAFPILALPLGQQAHNVMFKTLYFCPGLLKSIGVSNYTVDHLEELVQYATVVPAVLQVGFLGRYRPLTDFFCSQLSMLRLTWFTLIYRKKSVKPQ